MYRLLVVLVCLLGLSAAAAAQDLQVMSLDRFAVEAYQVKDNRDTYFGIANAPSDQPEYWTNGYAALFDVDFVRYRLLDFYYRGRVHAESTNQQVRQVGLQFETGVELSQYINLYWHHDSEHLADETGNGRYPLQNTIGLRWTVYSRDR